MIFWTLTAIGGINIFPKIKFYLILLSLFINKIGSSPLVPSRNVGKSNT